MLINTLRRANSEFRGLFFVLLFLSHFIFSESKGQYVLNGNAIQTTCNCYQLTDETANAFGSVWNSTMIDLNNSFDYSFNVNLGCLNSGADGMAFVLQPVSTSLGVAGGGLGYAGISPSLVIEFDTYQNPYDPSFDHLALLQNGEADHSNGNTLAGPIQASATASNIEDCATHDFRVVWNSTTQTIDIYFDGALRLTYTGDIVNAIFSGSPTVYWGFTASTGTAFNEHSFCVNLIPDFTLTPATGCEGEPIQFLDASLSNVGSTTFWQWNFGDGTPLVTGIQNPQHTYIAAGVYPVQLSVNDVAGCLEDTIISVTIASSPQVDFTTSPQSVCSNQPITFTDNTTVSGGSVVSWDYDFNETQGGPGSTHSTDQNPTFTYTQAGVYNVTLTAISDQGCTASKTLPVTIGSGPVVSFTNTQACNGIPTEFSDATVVSVGNITNYNWDFGDGTTSTDTNPSHQFTTLGTYQVQLSVTTDQGCTGSYSANLTVDESPVVTFEVFFACIYDTVRFINTTIATPPTTISSFAWDMGDGSPTLNNPDSVRYTYSTPNDYVVTLFATSNNGCTGLAQDTVEVWPTVFPQYVTTLDADSCIPVSITYDPWGTVVDQVGNQSNSLMRVLVDCGNGWNKYASPGELITCIYTLEGTYFPRVETITNHWCRDTVYREFNFYPPPIAGFTVSSQQLESFDPEVEIFDLSTERDTVSYTISDGFSITRPEFTHRFESIGCFEIIQTVVNNFECVSYDTIEVCVNEFVSLYIPNAVTFDGNRKNNIFKAEGEGIVSFEMEIFDRWGEHVFKTKSLDYGWNGIIASSGMEAPQGIYAYKGTAMGIDGELRKFMGHITVIK